MTFREFQFGKIIFLFTVPVQVLILYLFALQIGNRPMGIISFISVNGVLLLVYLLFYGMTTTIDAHRIRISYGIGLIRKSFKLEDIKSVEVVSNPWYYGWGIRLIPNGWLYNINGSAGVELRFRDRGSVIRIGSAVAEDLKRSIQMASKVSRD